MSRFEIAGPAPRIDGHRMYRGTPQLSKRDREIIAQIHLQGGLVHRKPDKTGFGFYLKGGAELPLQHVRRLLQLGYLILADDGLLPGIGQSILANTTPPLDVHVAAQ